MTVLNGRKGARVGQEGDAECNVEAGERAVMDVTERRGSPHQLGGRYASLAEVQRARCIKSREREGSKTDELELELEPECSARPKWMREEARARSRR